MCGTVVNDPGASCISCSVGACPLLFCSLCETLSHAESVSRPLLVPSFYLFAGPASGPRAKKAKVQADTAEAQTPGPAAPADTPAPDSAPPTTPGGAWTAAQDLELQRLVREEGYRKEVRPGEAWQGGEVPAPKPGPWQVQTLIRCPHSSQTDASSHSRPTSTCPFPQVLGKKHLKWSRIAEHFGHSKKSSRKRFTALTGEPAPE